METVVNRFRFPDAVLPQVISPTFDYAIDEVTSWPGGETQLQNALDFTNLIVAFDRKNTQLMVDCFEKTKWSLDQNIVPQHDSCFHDVIRTFKALSDMAAELGDNYNPNFVHMALCYKLKELRREDILGGFTFKKDKPITTSEFEDINFERDLKVVPMKISAATKNQLRSFFP